MQGSNSILALAEPKSSWPQDPTMYTMSDYSITQCSGLDLGKKEKCRQNTKSPKQISMHALLAEHKPKNARSRTPGSKPCQRAQPCKGASSKAAKGGQRKALVPGLSTRGRQVMASLAACASRRACSSVRYGTERLTAQVHMYRRCGECSGMLEGHCQSHTVSIMRTGWPGHCRSAAQCVACSLERTCTRLTERTGTESEQEQLQAARLGGAPGGIPHSALLQPPCGGS